MKFQGDSRVILDYLAFVYRTRRVSILLSWRVGQRIGKRTLVSLPSRYLYKKVYTEVAFPLKESSPRRILTIRFEEKGNLDDR